MHNTWYQLDPYLISNGVISSQTNWYHRMISIGYQKKLDALKNQDSIFECRLKTYVESVEEDYISDTCIFILSC